MSEFGEQLKALRSKTSQAPVDPPSAPAKRPAVAKATPHAPSMPVNSGPPHSVIPDPPARQPSKIAVSARIAALRARVAATRDQAPGLTGVLDGFDKQLDELREQLTRNPEVAISLIGGTGAGKSTLLNALVGARLLPVSNMRACTAAVSEVAWSEDGSYRAVVEFVPRASWAKEVDHLRQDIQDFERAAREAGEGDGHAAAGAAAAKAARDKLRAVYSPSGSESGRARLPVGSAGK